MSAGRFYGIDIAPDGSPMLACRNWWGTLAVTSFPATEAAYGAIRKRIGNGGSQAHVCLPSCKEAQPLARALAALRGVQITLVPLGTVRSARSRAERVRLLARLAEKLA